MDEAVAATSISMARRILLLENLPDEVKQLVMEDLKIDRSNLIKDLESEDRSLKKIV